MHKIIHTHTFNNQNKNKNCSGEVSLLGK